MRGDVPLWLQTVSLVLDRKTNGSVAPGQARQDLRRSAPADASPVSLSKVERTEEDAIVNSDDDEIERCRAAGFGHVIDAMRRRGRRLERKRCHAIMRSDEAAYRFAAARALATDTDFSVTRVLKLLGKTPVSGRGLLFERMKGVIPNTLGTPISERSGPATAEGSWARAMAPYMPVE